MKLKHVGFAVNPKRGEQVLQIIPSRNKKARNLVQAHRSLWLSYLRPDQMTTISMRTFLIPAQQT